MPHLKAPACPEGPPLSTLQSTSTLPSMLVKINGNNSYKQEAFLERGLVEKWTRK